MTRRLGLVLALTAAACSDPPHRPTDSPKETSMEPSLRSLAAHPELTITVRQGVEHFADGRVTLSVHGDGRVEVERRRSGQVTRAERRLPAARIDELGRAFDRHRLTAARTTSLPREPGDTPLVLRLDGDATPFQAELWYGDRYGDRDLDAIITLADTLIAEIEGAAR